MYATMEEQWLILITQTIRIFLFYHVKKEVCICAFLRDKNNIIIAHIYCNEVDRYGKKEAGTGEHLRHLITK